MAKRNVKAIQARHHEIQAWRMRCQGMSIYKIAEAIGITYQAVSRILIRLNARAMKDLGEQVETKKIEQDAMFDHVACEALDAWERSKKWEKRIDDDGKEVMVPTAEGNPKFLEEARQAIADKGKVWGIGNNISNGNGNGSTAAMPGIVVVVQPNDNPPVPTVPLSSGSDDVGAAHSTILVECKE